ncbi:hypothetical protein Tco_0691227 [Tanacetum coccineum]
MTTLAEHIIVVGAENRPPMLDKSMYNLWQSRANVYSLVNHCQAAKDIWDRVKLLVQGTELSYHERECKLYNEFDKTLQQVYVNINFLEYSSTRMEQGEGHMARQYTQPKRLRNFAWFKEKMLLVQAQESGQVLDEEQLAFLVDPGLRLVKAS